MNDSSAATTLSTEAMGLESVLDRVRDRWRSMEGVSLDDPWASKGFAAFSKTLYEASEFIEANRWKGEPELLVGKHPRKHDGEDTVALHD